MAAKEKSPRVGRARYVPDLKPGKYSDGLPLDEVKYLECKLILKPNHFTSRQSLFDFAKILRRPARESGVDFDKVNFTAVADEYIAGKDIENINVFDVHQSKLKVLG